jgi:hypothetical protein
MNPVSLDQLLAADPIASLQKVIVSTIKTQILGVTVINHPGKVDISELIEKTVVPAPGISIGWTRARAAGLSDGSYGLAVEWVAYIVAAARVVGLKRTEKEEVGIALGARLLAILNDLMPVSETPVPELKPIFTVKDAAQGTAYYTVTWTQVIPDVGQTYFPQVTGTVAEDAGTISYEDEAWAEAIAPFIAEIADA